MRKEVTYVVEDQASRDFGKEFLITEMSAMETDNMAMDLFRVMGEQGWSEMPADVISMGCAGLATVGLPVLTSASPEVSRALRDRLLQTVQIVITHNNQTQQRPVNPAIDFEEVSTIRSLLDKTFGVNFGFLAKGSE